MRWLAAITLLLLPCIASAQQAFQLPTGNIHCRMMDGELLCHVAGRVRDSGARMRDCLQDSARLRASGRSMLVCDGDDISNSAAAALRVGDAWQQPGITCAAAPAGLRCVNADGHGFEMARARVRVF